MAKFDIAVLFTDLETGRKIAGFVYPQPVEMSLEDAMEECSEIEVNLGEIPERFHMYTRIDSSLIADQMSKRNQPINLTLNRIVMARCIVSTQVVEVVS